MPRHLISSINRTMLSARTTKANHQVGKATFDIIFHCRIDNVKNVIEKAINITVLLQEINHGLIAAGQFLVGFVPAGIMNCPAIK